ncbi:MAG TPA: hypothetical protein VJV78_20265 [Polyangiales bacterium]|nr:hypothetical protein [Polyangiales bacterium]
MNDDLLQRAAQAVRDNTDSVQPRSGLTRARMLDAAEKRYGTRRFQLRWAVAFVAALGASTALARVVQYWPEITRAITGKQAEPQPAPVRRAPARPKVTKAVAPPAPQPEPPVVTEAPPAPVVSEPSAPPAVAPKRRPRAAAPLTPIPETSAPAPTPAPAESAELAIFRRAQRLHLAHDPQALAAWDDYLRVANQGVLVPEARYNRALCLVRLGRVDEARAALEPFARGEYGSYRRTEAAALIEALSHRKP